MRHAAILATESQEAVAIERLAEDRRAHGGDPASIRALSSSYRPNVDALRKNGARFAGFLRAILKQWCAHVM